MNQICILCHAPVFFFFAIRTNCYRSHTPTNIVGKQCWQTASKQFSSVFAKKPQTNIHCFLFPIGNRKQDTMFASADTFQNTSSVYRELPQKQVPRTWTIKFTLKLNTLLPTICSNASKSVGSILTFIEPASSSTIRSAKRYSPYLVLSLRKYLVHQCLQLPRRHLPFNKNI